LSGDSHFFLGTDSAPHARNKKESACGCAGIYSAHAAIELYAEVFSSHNALDKLENFASIYGPRFYKMPINETTITLTKEPWQVPFELSFGDSSLVPLFAGETLQWKLKTDFPGNEK
jgi:dihydroorotase